MHILVAVTNPAAGAEWIHTVPTGKFWRIRSILHRLTTDATVANRESRLNIDDGVFNLWQSQNDIAQTASTGVYYNYAPGCGIGEVASPSSDSRQYSLPALILLPGYRIRSTTVGIVAGDQYTNIRIMVDERDVEFGGLVQGNLIPWAL